MRKHWPFLIGLGLTLSLLWPLVVAPYFSHDDNVQTMRIYEMHACLADGQVPCRWVPDLGGGYGYPEFNYYAPLPYYVGAAFYQLTQDIIVAAKLTFAAAFVLAFISMYLLGNLLWGKLGGSLAAIFYVFAPYHALNMYHRGAMGELWAVGLFPLVFWALLRLRSNPTRWNSLLLGVTAALLIVSHNLTALIVLAVVACIGLWQMWSLRQRSYTLHLVIAGAYAVGLSAFYVFPMVLESGFIHLETMTLNEYNYSQHFETLQGIVRESPWWSPSNTKGVSHQLGTMHVLVWLTSVIIAGVLWRRDRQLGRIVAGCSVVIAVCIFMMVPASRWLWANVPDLQYVQFPWRFLTLASFATSILAGVAWRVLRGNTAQVLVWSGLAAAVVVANFGWFQPDRFLNVTQSQLLTNSGWDNLRMFAISDFLPKSAQQAPSQPSTALAETTNGQAVISQARAGSNWVSFVVSSPSGAQIQIDKYDFPTWDVSVDGRPVAYTHDSATGLLALSVPGGTHTVDSRLRNTPVRLIGDVVSASAVMICAVMCLVWLTLRSMAGRQAGWRIRTGALSGYARVRR